MRGNSPAVVCRPGRRGALAAAFVVAGMLAGASGASAASFSVTDSTDAALSNPAGTTCVSTDSGKCTLRAAVQAADNLGGSSTISVAAGTYTLTIASTGADDSSTGDLDINANVSLTVTGAGAASTVINANHLDRAFAVQEHASLAISGVTVEHGVASESGSSTNSTSKYNGGAFYNDGSLSIDDSSLVGNYSWDNGGAVYSDSDATATSITNSTASGNTADDPGGVVYVSAGTVNLANDDFNDNSANDTGGVLHDSGGTTVNISGTTISDTGSGDDGGAIYLAVSGATMISDSTIEGSQNDDDNGGALYADTGGSISIDDSTFADNSSGDETGGAIYTDGSTTLTITGSTFEGNSSGNGDGGAIYTDGTDLSITHSSFLDNQGGDGGALYVHGTAATATESVTSSTFAGNGATDDSGGAIYDEDGNLSLTRSTLSDNNAGQGGGALYYDSGDGLEVTNDTFDSNVAAQNGGAIDLSTNATTGTLSLLSDTISRNAAYAGGGIAYPNLASSIEDTIVAGNYGGTGDESGEDCYDGSGHVASDTAGAADKGGNIDSDGTCFSAGVSDDHVDVDPDLGALAVNGGLTQTDALEAGSPAIGAAVAGSCPATDQRGVARPSACDSGAFQTSSTSLALSAAAPSKSVAGHPLTYTFDVSDAGAAPATGVVFTDKLPAGSSYYSSSSSQGACTGTSTVTCSLGVLDAAATSGTGAAGSAVVTVVVIPSHAGTFADTGTAVADSAGSVSKSASTKVTAPPSLPVAITGAASQIKSGSAKLSGVADPEGASTTYYFQYGTTKHYGKSTKHKTLAAGTSLRSVVVSIKGLKAGKTYHFRLVAENANGTFDGKDVKFKTKKKS